MEARVADDASLAPDLRPRHVITLADSCALGIFDRALEGRIVEIGRRTGGVKAEPAFGCGGGSPRQLMDEPIERIRSGRADDACFAPRQRAPLALPESQAVVFQVLAPAA